MRIVVSTRKCRVCKIEKPFAELVPNRASLHGFKPLCKICRSEYYRQRLANDPLMRKRRADAVLRSKRLTKHGIRPADYDRMVKEQGDKCKFCGTSDKGRHDRFRTWNIDHDHKTNQVRGLLCHTCNIAIGHFENLVDRFGLDAILSYVTPPTESPP